jgi:DMSO/TMAO reductase YedYZ molybdopterin-dependent catalytic subunit
VATPVAPAPRSPGSVPPGQIVTRRWPVLHAGSVPADLTPATWSLRLLGEVERTQSLSFAELLGLPQLDLTVDIHCVTSWTRLGMRWRGVPFRAVEAVARPRPEVRYVVMECEQGFTTSLPIEALRDDDVLLAHAVDGAPLPAEHGGPVRMLVPKRYFYKSAKWLRGLKFVAHDEPGFWEVRGYSNIADPWRETRYDVDDVKVIHRMRKDALFRPVEPSAAPKNR